MVRDVSVPDYGVLIVTLFGRVGIGHADDGIMPPHKDHLWTADINVSTLTNPSVSTLPKPQTKRRERLGMQQSV
jgi:hypothetical protein